MKVSLFLALYPKLDSNPSWNAQPPLSLGYLASYARSRMSNVEFSIHRRIEDLIAEKPDFVGITYTTFNASYAARQARKIKEEIGCPVLVGGPHISSLPASLDLSFDVGVVNEGEETFVELLSLYQKEGSLSPASLEKVQGIVFRDADGNLRQTGPRPPIADLDTIPYPARDLMMDEWPVLPSAPIGMLTSRGCPFSCAFCKRQTTSARSNTRASTQYILGEMEHLRNTYNPEKIKFEDDAFVLKKSTTIELLQAIRERGLHEGIELSCSLRADLVDDELFEELAKTNFTLLHVGFESGSDSVLKIQNKRLTMADIQNAIDLARKHGLLFTSCFFFGTPGETRDDILATFDFVYANMDVLPYVAFSPLYVFPDTEMWKYAEKVGVSETSLQGVVFEQEDLDHEKAYLLQRWPFLNADNMSREEVYCYLQIGQQIAKHVSREAELRNEVAALQMDMGKQSDCQHIAGTVPLSTILMERAKRRLARCFKRSND